ncbi:MAG: serine hydrolase [Candidatus Bipolaricaulota bacterium]
MKRKMLVVLIVTGLLAGAGGGSCPRAEPPPLRPQAANGEPDVPPAIATREPAAGATITFAYGSPESQGVASEALQDLAEIVRGFVENDGIVGAELVVLKNRCVLLHESFGWKDRDDGQAMAIDTLFNIRSMTKPVVGTAVQMLIDDGQLAPGDAVAKYLPSFDNARSRAITIEMLLTHRSGLPMSLIAASFGEYTSLRRLADAAGERGPDFQPGSAFQYSDAGFEVLGALVEVVSGVPLQQFVQQRILDPLGMADTIMLPEPDDPRVERMASLYFGARGSWSLLWSQDRGPLYPFAMGSQSLYSTPLDYARFLTLWMDCGVIGDRQLLSPEATRRALTPVSDSKLSGGFHGLRLDYGQAWIVYVPQDAPEGGGAVALFGHSGSDGTWAWAWPDQDLLVLYFTQSRGQGTGTILESEVDRLLIHPGRYEAELPAELEPLLGTYTALSGPLMYQEFEIVALDGGLAVRLPEQVVVPLEGPDRAGRWTLAVDPSLSVSFVLDEQGDATRMHWHQAGEVFDLPRGAAPEEPPLDREAVQKYLGRYKRPEDGATIEVVIYNGHLGVVSPEVSAVLELFPPSEEGAWRFRLNPAVYISFQVGENGEVASFTAHTPEGDFVRPRSE